MKTCQFLLGSEPLWAWLSSAQKAHLFKFGNHPWAQESVQRADFPSKVCSDGIPNSLCKLLRLGIHPYFTPRHEPYLIRVTLLDELRTTIDAEPASIMSFPGVLVFATAFYGNLLVDHLATIGAIPHWHIGPAVVKVGTSIRFHFTVFPLRLL